MTRLVHIGCFAITVWLANQSSRLLPDGHSRSAEFVLLAIVSFAGVALYCRWLRGKSDDFRELLNKYSRAVEDRTRAELWSACHSGPFPIAAPQDDVERSRRYVQACQIAREMHDRVMEGP